MRLLLGDLWVFTGYRSSAKHNKVNKNVDIVNKNDYNWLCSADRGLSEKA